MTQFMSKEDVKEITQDVEATDTVETEVIEVEEVSTTKKYKEFKIKVNITLRVTKE